jgi:uncharacterized SAM-binding protein YcdF (DUF218 family)
MFYYASKILWILAQPSNLLLLLVVVGALALWLERRRLAAWLLYPAALALLVTGLMPVGKWLMLPLENRFPMLAEPLDRVDGIIVLGGAVDLGVAESRGLVAFKESAERNIALIELAKRHPDATVVFSGGRAGFVGAGLTEADVVHEFVRRHGLDGRVILEDRSRNTYENAAFSKPLAAPAPGERWLLVTSASHMPRSVGVFRQLCWPVVAYPVDYRTSDGIEVLAIPDAAKRWSEFDEATKAWVGLVAYWLTGRSSALFPAP